MGEDRRRGSRSADLPGRGPVDPGLDWIRQQQQTDGSAEVVTLPISGSGRPEILVLCGSLRFEQINTHTALRETLAGKAVLSVIDLDVDLPAEVQDQLARADRGRIAQADRVLVLNVGGYIGPATRLAIAYATQAGKPVGYLEPPASTEGRP